MAFFHANLTTLLRIGPIAMISAAGLLVAARATRRWQRPPTTKQTGRTPAGAPLELQPLARRGLTAMNAWHSRLDLFNCTDLTRAASWWLSYFGQRPQVELRVMRNAQGRWQAHAWLPEYGLGEDRSFRRAHVLESQN